MSHIFEIRLSTVRRWSAKVLINGQELNCQDKVVQMAKSRLSGRGLSHQDKVH
jgi:hypothetical protein